MAHIKLWRDRWQKLNKLSLENEDKFASAIATNESAALVHVSSIHCRYISNSSPVGHFL
jgi:hypothetical protein